MKTIVVDIPDPTDGAADGVAAAKAFAGAGDRVLLFHSLHHPNLDDAKQHSSNALIEEARNLLVASRERLLRKIGDQLDSVPVKCHVDWTGNGWQALLKFAQENAADLIIARSDRATPWRPLARANQDWQLIRHSSVPLLLTRSDGRTGYSSVLAAIDPLHTDDKPAELDHRILDHAGDMARRHAADLCVLNVVAPVAQLTAATAAAALPMSPAADSERLGAHRNRLDHLVHETACPATERCVVPGIPADEIVQHAADHDVDLVVMGAVSRSMLRNALIGNTAEKVLDKLDADTLIIKPAAVATPQK